MNKRMIFRPCRSKKEVKRGPKIPNTDIMVNARVQEEAIGQTR